MYATPIDVVENDGVQCVDVHVATATRYMHVAKANAWVSQTYVYEHTRTFNYTVLKGCNALKS